MKDRLFLEVRRFFSSLSGEFAPYLLALSGGPDSMALFHCLQKLGLPFTVLYIDHGWREESASEMHALREMTGRSGIPFVGRQLPPLDLSIGNVEDRLRELRREVYTQVARQVGARSVVTGHQQDDVIETTLKRLLEGAHLDNLHGMQAVGDQVEGMAILRPLLNVRKGDILTWLDQENHDYFVDHTNQDKRYLRARMRGQLIPQIEKGFGKKITSNLASLSEQSVALRGYLDERIAPFLEGISWGECVELSLPDHDLERRHFFRVVARRLGITFSKRQLHDLVTISKGGVSGKFIYIRGWRWRVKKKNVIVEKVLPARVSSN